MVRRSKHLNSKCRVGVLTFSIRFPLSYAPKNHGFVFPTECELTIGTSRVNLYEYNSNTVPYLIVIQHLLMILQIFFYSLPYQVVIIAVYSYFLCQIFACQFVESRAEDKESKIDLYIPIFSIFSFLFLMGWLKVSTKKTAHFSWAIQMTFIVINGKRTP